MDLSVEERFWSKVDTSGTEEHPDCWEWTAYRRPTGYGHFRFRGKQWKAHRVAYTLIKGEIPEGQCVLHIECDNPPCVNPAHLKTGTQADNMRDRDQKGRHVSHHTKKTHCPQGHPYSGDNLYTVPSTGRRQCCECGRIKVRKHRKRKRIKEAAING